MNGLVIDDLSVERSGTAVIRQLSLEARCGEVTVLLGPNGSGKTTLLEAISGVIAPRAGTVTLGGIAMQRMARQRRSRLGLAHVEQGRGVFGQMTTAENIAAAPGGRAFVDEAFRFFPELLPRRDTPAGLLSGGEQQMVVIARALATRPKILLLDEMSLGLAPVIVHRLIAAIRRLADEQGTGVLLVEQFAALALSIGDRAYVMSRGSLVYSGACEPLQGTTDILRGAYLGAGEANGAGRS